MVSLLKESQGNSNILTTSTRKTPSNRSQPKAKSIFSQGGGAHYLPNRYIGQGMHGPAPRENGIVNNNSSNRNNNWNRENRGNHGNERPNHWGPERRPNNRHNREDNDVVLG